MRLWKRTTLLSGMVNVSDAMDAEAKNLHRNSYRKEKRERGIYREREIEKEKTRNFRTLDKIKYTLTSNSIPRVQAPNTLHIFKLN